MYSSIRRYKIDSKNIDELTRKVREEFVPIVSGLPGFVDYYLMDTGEGVIASINIFEEETGAKESNKRAAAWSKKYPDLFPSSAEIIEGPILIRKAK